MRKLFVPSAFRQHSKQRRLRCCMGSCILAGIVIARIPEYGCSVCLDGIGYIYSIYCVVFRIHVLN